MSKRGSVVRASLPSLCCAECPGFDPRSDHKLLSLHLNSQCSIPYSVKYLSTLTKGRWSWQNKFKKTFKQIKFKNLIKDSFVQIPGDLYHSKSGFIKNNCMQQCIQLQGNIVCHNMKGGGGLNNSFQLAGVQIFSHKITFCLIKTKDVSFEVLWVGFKL